MPDATDMELVRDYVQHGAEAAFAGLVQRHVHLVYSIALRYTGNPALAEEITQAVFVILARKAATLRPHTILEGWLHETTRLTAWSAGRAERRRQFREQEAFMQSSLQNQGADPAVWHQIAPLLDEALARLGPADRDAVMLRFFKGQDIRNVAATLRVSEAAAQRRLLRALEKLRKFFGRRGVHSTTEIIAGSIAAYSIQIAPIALVQAVTAAGASASTLTLIKGALKLMAWTKTKIAVTAGIGVLFLAGTTIIAIRKIQEHRTYSWQRANFEPVPMIAPQVLGQTKPQVRIVKSKYDHLIVGFFSGEASKFVDGAWVPMTTNSAKCIGVGVTADSIVLNAYHSDVRHTVFRSPLPSGLFDYIANLPVDSLSALQREIRRQWGLTGTRQLVDTPVLVLKIADPNRQAFKPANSLRGNSDELSAATLTQGGSSSHNNADGSYAETRFNTPVSFLMENFESQFNLPVVNETGLTNRYDYSIAWPVRRTADQEAWLKVYRQSIRDQLGLELVPTNMPMEMLVVQKVP